ncbi:hypothetical protein ACMAVI_000356 [Burkholderia cenocepacia]
MKPAIHLRAASQEDLPFLLTLRRLTMTEHLVSLSVLHGNPARRLYERLGFRVASATDTSASMVWHA